MGLFVKRSEVGSSVPLYTTSANKTVLIAGLGNIGKQYDGTRHNIGFKAVDALASYLNLPWALKKDLKSFVATGTVGGVRVVIMKPTTFMNLSGEAVQAVAHFYKVAIGDIVVIHDELDIDFGKIRVGNGGSGAGHNGIKSVIEHIGENFGRVRIGIGSKKPAQMDSADFVLAKFADNQQEGVEDLAKEVVSIANDFAASGQLYAETRTVIF